MKVLVATSETQGQRANDFMWCEEGEPVSFAFECDGETIDGPCGCRRSMGGLDSHKATTTVKVVWRNGVGPKTLAAMIQRSMRDGGWGDDAAFAEAEAAEIARIAATFPTGTVLEKRGNLFRRRTIPGQGKP